MNIMSSLSKQNLAKRIALTAAMTLSVICGASANDEAQTAPEKTPDEKEKKVDDWQFDPTQGKDDFVTTGSPVPGTSHGPIILATKSYSKSTTGGASIGISTGGAKDINNFRENISNNYLPLPTDVTYEGLFYNYLFDTGLTQPCTQLFCPSYTSALAKDPFSGHSEYFLSVGLNSGIEQSDFARKKLNLVIVLDISGSMRSPFNRYYYDLTFPSPRTTKVDLTPEEQEEWSKTKMQVASEAVVALLDHLNPEDSLGVVLFDHQSHLAKPLRKVGETDMEAIKGHILELRSRGGTNMSAGMMLSRELFQDYPNAEREDVENRVIFLTDAQPNHGALSEEGIAHVAEQGVKDRIHTTFIGVGVDFNTKLIESIINIRGANYYAVHSPSEFKDRMDENFDYMVTPLAFDLELAIEAPGFEIQAVYGSPEADQATSKIMKVSTLFPAEKTAAGTRGGLILLQMRRRTPFTDSTLKLNVSYEDRNGNQESHATEFSLGPEPSPVPEAPFEYYDNLGIRKGIVLARYATLLKNWMLHERAKMLPTPPHPIPDPIEWYHTQGMPSHHVLEGLLGQWERQSKALVVSEEYSELFGQFSSYLLTEMEAIGDDSMTKEWELLLKLLETGAPTTHPPQTGNRRRSSRNHHFIKIAHLAISQAHLLTAWGILSRFPP